MVGNFAMLNVGPERRVNQTLDGLVCPGVPMISKGHWVSRMILDMYLPLFSPKCLDMVFELDMGMRLLRPADCCYYD